jgi:hypothetical protein
VGATYGSYHLLVTVDCRSQASDFANLSQALELSPGKLGPALAI